MKRRIFIFILTLICVLSLSGCTVGRKNSAENLKITAYDKSTNTYTIEYIETKLDFGKFFIEITDEAVTKMYCEFNNKKYKLGDYYITIGGYSISINEIVEGKNASLSLTNPFKLVKSVDDKGIETLNSQTIVFYVEFIDVNTPNDGTSVDGLIDSVSIKLSTNAKDLLTFIRNKAPKTA